MRDGLVGELLRPALGEPTQSGFFGRLSCAVVLLVVLSFNIYLLSLLAYRLCVVAVWIELLLLFLAFFYLFNLDFEFIARKLPFLVTRGLFTTIYVSLISICIACVIAWIVAIAKLSRNPIFYAVAAFYVSFFRGLPLLMQIYLIYIGLPQIGYAIDPVPAGIVALSVCYGAYMAEIFRAGIMSVPPGQREAALSLGLSEAQTMRKIIFPQAMKLIVPPTGNQFIAMLKDSSLVSIVGVWELTFIAKSQGKSEFKYLEMLIVASMLYWIISIFFELLQAKLEAHYNKSTRATH